MRDVYFAPYGGLGNQLFQFACALALAEGGKVHILGEWGSARRDSFNRIEVYGMNLGDRVEFESKTASTPLRRGLNLFLRLSAEGRTNSYLKRMIFFITSIFVSIRLRRILRLRVGDGVGFSDIKRHGNLYVIGYFQSHKWSDEVIDELLKISARALSPKAIDLIRELDSRDVLIVHVRRGDYKSQDFGIVGDAYYANALEAHKQTRYDEIWVFSDEQELAREIPALSIHPNVVFVDDRDLTSVEILEIMRGGSGFIIANSSFSWWAATLRAKRNALVVCPHPWFKTRNTPAKIIHPSWVSIPW